MSNAQSGVAWHGSVPRIQTSSADATRGDKGRRWTEPRVTCLGTGRSGPLGLNRNMQHSVVQKHSNRHDRLAKGAYLGPYQLGPEKRTDGL
jgi:hypothetical protein